MGDFDARATTYENGWRGRMHRDIAERTAAVVEASFAVDPAAPRQLRVLDVGCGTGLVLRSLASRLPDADTLIGVDAAPSMVQVASARADKSGDTRLAFREGTAEQLPFADGSFDLVVSAVSFHHWRDQAGGLAECHRVLAPGGRLVLTDLVWLGLVPAMVVARRHRERAKTRGQVERLLRGAGFAPPRWHRLYAFVISTAVAEH